MRIISTGIKQEENRTRTGLYKGLSNEELVELYKAGDTEAFDELMKKTEALRSSLAQRYLNIPGRCRDNPKYSDYPTSSYFSKYKPVCPQGYTDCVCDLAYLKCYHPLYYKNTYGDLTPEEVAKKNCSIDDDYCYDDEDK